MNVEFFLEHFLGGVVLFGAGLLVLILGVDQLWKAVHIDIDPEEFSLARLVATLQFTLGIALGALGIVVAAVGFLIAVIAGLSYAFQVNIIH